MIGLTTLKGQKVILRPVRYDDLLHWMAMERTRSIGSWRGAIQIASPGHWPTRSAGLSRSAGGRGAMCSPSPQQMAISWTTANCTASISDRNAWLAIGIARPYWSQGYGSDAIRTLPRYQAHQLRVEANRVGLEEEDVSLRRGPLPNCPPRKRSSQVCLS